MRKQFKELSDYLWPHTLILRLQSDTSLKPSHNQKAYRYQQNGSDDPLRPHTVDAPLLQDVCLQITEKSGKEKADLGELEHQPPAPHQCRNADRRIAHDAQHRDRNMPSRLGVFIESMWRKDGETAVIDCTAIEFLRHRAWRSQTGVHVVNTQRHR